MSTLTSHSYEETVSYGSCLGDTLAGGELILLSGQLGSGKTVLTKGIAASLGIVEVVTSPSFAIMNLYEGRLLLSHFDFYRIDQRAEMEDLLEDYVYRSDCICVVEWGDALTRVLESYIHIHIDIVGDTRNITESRMDMPGKPQVWRGADT
jgi:tRNA threonylcarbamoyladenosine biosynthesis protein TsaE